MGTPIPQFWIKKAEPQNGPYRLVTLAGWDFDGDPAQRKVLYVVKSMTGCLNEAFEWREVGKHWKAISKKEAKRLAKEPTND